MADLLREKQFPGNYPKDVMAVIDALSMGRIRVVGSQSLSSQQYAADYDLNEVVKDKRPTAFQAVIKRLLNLSSAYIGDIKAGEVPEWRIVDGRIEGGRLIGYSAAAAKKRLKALADKGIISAAEEAEAKRLLKPKPSVEEWFEMVGALKFHVVRWTPTTVLRGFCVLRNGRKFTLAEALKSNGVVKIDVVAYVQCRFTDFSCIYIYKSPTKSENISLGIQEDLLWYATTGEFFKVAKRMFSVARLEKRYDDINKLNTIINSDLGRLYSIISDASTILYLLEEENNLPMDKIRNAIDSFRGRLGTIYSLPKANSRGVLDSLLAMGELPTNTKGRTKLADAMNKLIGFFTEILNKGAKQELTDAGLLPLKKPYTP